MARRRKRPDGRIERAFRYNGKTYHVYGRSAEELNRKEREKREDLETGRQLRDNPTLKQYYEQFTEARRDKVSGNTMRTNRYLFGYCAKVVLPGIDLQLGEMRMKDIRPKDILQVQAALIQEGRSTTTANHAMAHLKHIFREAVKDETIDRNPCIVVSKIKRAETEARDTIHRALTPAETKAFFEAAKGNYYYNALLMLLQTGLRIGELAALVETDIDTGKGLLHVSRTITKTESGLTVIGDSTKTKKGRRDIPINSAIMQVVKAQKAINYDLFGNTAVLFRSLEGALLDAPILNGEIERICRAAGVERFTCHALRATFATRFIEQRPQDYKVLSELLGHSNINITLDLYTHTMNETKAEAMKELIIAY
ncbi:MAG: site-specific integrase [Acidaminococcaceae bacterium]|nr:site-specific integrase [Acidaminococcaceae bacterium]